MASSLEESQCAPQNKTASASSAITRHLLISSALAALGSFNFGYNLATVNTTAKTFRNCSDEDEVWDCFSVDKFTWGYVVSILCLGALLSSLAAGPIADRLGRRKTILLTNIPYILGISVIVYSQNLFMLLLGRLLVGVGVGGVCIVVPIYLTELSPVADRGLIGSLHQMGITIGFLFGEVVPLFGLYREFYWRFMFGLAWIPCLVQITGMLFFSPESPRYLILSHRIDEGETALRYLRAEWFSECELAALMEEYHAKDQNQEELWSLLDLLYRHVSQSGRSMIAAAALHLGQQFSGINSVLLFSDSIFSKDSSSDDRPNLVPLLIAILNVLMTVAAISAIDRVGRRFLALSSSGTMSIAGFVLTVALVLDWRWLSIGAVLVFVGSFAFGMGPVPWLMTNELFPTQAVSSAESFAVSLNLSSNLLVTTSFPKLSHTLGSFAFLPYSLCTLVFFGYSFWFLPETKGRPVDFL